MEGRTESKIGSQRSGEKARGDGRRFSGYPFLKATPLIAIALVLASLILSLSSGCTEKVKPGTAEVKRQPVSGVTVAEVSPTKVDEYYETSGTVKARTTSVIASRVMGTVTSLTVREGERVKAGPVL